MLRFSTGLAGLLALALFAQVSPADEKVDYLKQIKPILVHRCTSCHGALKQKSGLRLDAAALIRKGGENGAAIVPGKAAESPLIAAVTGEAGFQMPLDAEPLKPEQIALLRLWIDQGAVAPADEKIPPAPNEHWAYKQPVRPALPQPKRADWVRNPIDAFLAAEHEQRGLTPQSPAAKHLLLRRVYLDLVGLPPSPDELRAFLADDSPDAYDKVVDALLESPRYGERWGRHWMDVWRYADWYGYQNELRNSARHIWRWRDWIIESLNADRPYDQMIVEMLAADELDPTNAGSLRATGFLARHYYKFNRHTWLDSAIEHTSKSFLGLTMNCARCHDHKYDPVSQEEYYRFRALFEPYQVRTDRIPGQANVDQDGLPRVFDAEPDAKTYLFQRGNDKSPDIEHPLTATVPAFLEGPKFEIHPVELPSEAYYPGARSYIRQEELAAAKSGLAARQAALKVTELAATAAKETLAEARRGRDAAVASAQQASSNGGPVASTNAAPFLVDDFTAPKPQLWRLIGGKWEYKDGRLWQQEVVNEQRSLNSAFDHPRDFSATFRFRIVGGQTYHSVGLSFDDVGGASSDGVYLSAHDTESKLQVLQKRDGNATYPDTGRIKMPVERGSEHTLRVDVRDRLLNVYVDGLLRMVYTLPHERRTGRFSLWTFDCAAEFIQVRVDPLPETFVIADKLPDGAASATLIAAAETAVSDAAAAVDVAKKQLVAALSTLSAIQARIAADNARFNDAHTEFPSPLAGEGQGGGANATRRRGDAETRRGDETEARGRAVSHSAPGRETPSPLAGEGRGGAALVHAPDAGPVDPHQLALAASIADRNETLYKSLAALAEGELKLAHAERAAAGDDAKEAEAATKLKADVEAARKALKEAQDALGNVDANYKPLTQVFPQTSTGRRLALARWIADKKNPLTARVAVNHIWMRHFGKPLVATTFDFGMNGRPPTHPQLLDWLAVEFMENGWSMKHLHRLMVTSNAYRMSSSTLMPEGRQNETVDADNLYYWRMNARRMEAEVVRDSLLAVAGELDLTMGGPDLDAETGQATFRRSVYYRHAPEKYMTFLKLFDVASADECYRRNETVVPQQALAMANSPLSISQARRLAARINSSVGTAANVETEAAYIDSLFERVLCRPPTDDERQTCRQFLAEQSARLADPKQLTSFEGGEAVQPAASADPHLHARESLAHVLLNHNEFVTAR
ncbi:MAG: PSD1 and planctomycete cytochrome C domain-containing protein [Planctomycetaceae bacterium]